MWNFMYFPSLFIGRSNITTLSRVSNFKLYNYFEIYPHENRKGTGCKLAFSVIPLLASSWHGVGFVVNRANNDVI